MLTIDALQAFGADTADGLNRCMGNADFYIRLIGKAMDDKNFAALETALNAKDLDAAFEAAHSLKGVLGNLALTPIYKPVFEMTELLRARTDTDYGPMLSEVLTKKAELKALMD
ncbi:MAG: Hpt domain-containing protein [Ruminococcaceae bacterium]|nr:Hpt domain-containing protein [Oscillospiraceae bacterium]